MALNEIASAADSLNLPLLAADAGYATSFDGGGSPFGSDRNGFLTSLNVAAQTVNTSASLSGDVMANDVTRYLVEGRFSVPSGRDLTVVSGHWKSGATDLDEFRRTVDSHRILQCVADLSSGSDAFVLMDDVNEDVVDVPGTPDPFTALPGGLPGSYVLGSDLAALLPTPGFTNNPFAYLAGLDITGALRLDGSAVTRPSSGRRLDYIVASDLVSAFAPSGEVYDSADEGLSGGKGKFGAAPEWSTPPRNATTAA